MKRELADKHFKLPGSKLAALVRDAREHTLAQVADLSDEQLTVPYLEVVNPFRWELGHIAYFYEVFLLRMLDEMDPLMAEVDHFYDSFKVDHQDRWALALPPRDETLNYLSRVFDLTIERLNSRQPDPKETYLYLLCVHHEDMHGEAFTAMRQALEYPSPGDRPAADDVGEGPLPGDVEIPGGTFQLGATAGAAFVFDNEKWAHPVEVAPFRIARAPVTNAQFVEFVENEGYLRRELWSAQGWVWRTKAGAQHPRYWKRGAGWLRQHFNRLVPLEEHAPMVHVNWYEAEAYCSWAGRRLPSEIEWEVAASAEPGGEGGTIGPHKRTYPWGNQAPDADRANLDGRFSGCADVAAFPGGDSAFGCRQMIGNVWEWTASAFYPYPGYVVDFPYREYSAPWFGYRKVLKGGAWSTRARLAYCGYRNFFLPHRSDLFAGFRTCAK